MQRDIVARQEELDPGAQGRRLHRVIGQGKMDSYLPGQGKAVKRLAPASTRVFVHSREVETSKNWRCVSEHFLVANGSRMHLGESRWVSG